MQNTFWGHSETFWVGIQAVSAVLGFAVLYFYTVYTRRMMKLAEETRRVAITPVFSLRKWGIIPTIDPATMTEIYYDVRVTIRNIGQGPAVAFSAWYQPLSDKFTPKESVFLPPTPLSAWVQPGKRELLPKEKCSIQFQINDCKRRWLFIIQSTDTAKGNHQLQIFLGPRADGELSVQLIMVHGLGESTAERFVAGASRFVQVVKAIERMVEDIESGTPEG